jgi:hypothetical protein
MNGHIERNLMAGACRMQESSGSPTSGANQHLVAHAGASFQDEASRPADATLHLPSLWMRALATVDVG